MLCQCPKGAVNAVYAQNYNELANLILQAQSHRENLLRLPLDVHPLGPFVFTHSNPNSVGCPFSFPTFDSDKDGKVIVRQVAVQLLSEMSAQSFALRQLLGPGLAQNLHLVWSAPQYHSISRSCQLPITLARHSLPARHCKTVQRSDGATDQTANPRK